MDKDLIITELAEETSGGEKRKQLEGVKKNILAALKKRTPIKRVFEILQKGGWDGTIEYLRMVIKEWTPEKKTKKNKNSTDKQFSVTSQIPQGRVVLSVPIEEKDEAKALGAKWDNEKKTWYVPEGIALGAFSRWR
jgi:Na+-translocating ferredoxin:NAD+ oxidoreductase RnfG subunit